MQHYIMLIYLNIEKRRENILISDFNLSKYFPLSHQRFGIQRIQYIMLHLVRILINET